MAAQFTCSLAVELGGALPTQASVILYYPDQQMHYIFINNILCIVSL